MHLKLSHEFLSGLSIVRKSNSQWSSFSEVSLYENVSILSNLPTYVSTYVYVYVCTYCNTDHFELIANNQVSISSIVNKAKERDCELNSDQTILMLNEMQFLKNSYPFMLKKMQEI